ncbi:MAG: redoxin family protein [Phycisphaeraceae bacterium]|nr:redoxin family protein [Phycisphaeraceae bacterium]
MLTRLLAAGLIFCAAGAVVAQDSPSKEQPAPAKAEKPASKKLSPGDKAPALSIEKWVKGEPVTGFENGRTYVIEFWATWCGPCIASMPHLTELQSHYKDKGLTIIGVTSADPNNSLDDVTEMVKEKGDGMGYTVAWDTDRETYDAYMKAAKQNGIPTAFVVNSAGVIAYIGHPSRLDKPLEQIIAGTYDIKAAAEREAKRTPLMKAIGSSIQAGEWDTALAKTEELIALDPENGGDIAASVFATVLKGADDPTSAYAFARKAVDGSAKDNAMALNIISWSIVDPEADVSNKDLDLAMAAAKRCDEISGSKEPAFIDTLARVYFLKGDKVKAIELQEKAVRLADGDMREQLEESLAEYKAAGSKN